MNTINPAHAIARAALGEEVMLDDVDEVYQPAVQLVNDADDGTAGIAALESYRKSGPRPSAIIEQLSTINPDATEWPRLLPPVTGHAPEADPDNSQATEIIAIGQQAELFHDQGERPHARFLAGGVERIREIGSRDFKNFLRRSFYELQGKPPGNEPLSQALGVLESIALFDQPQIELSNRVARHDGDIWYDLGDGHAVRIHSGGWEVVGQPPTLFRHYSHQLPQVHPERGGSLDAIFECINVRDEFRLLLKVWLVAAFIPDIPHPIPDLHGSKGSGKSIGTRALRRVIDPSTVEMLPLSGSDADLVQRLDHHYVCLFDNIGNVTPRVSDILCRAVTGAGHSDRLLYSNDGDFTRAFRRVIMLNGINVVAQQPDLLDRSMQFDLERIDPTHRREERELWEVFEEQLPYVMGAAFDALAAAMAIYDGLALPRLNRMADFSRWGAAIAEALGDGAQQFLEDYDHNLSIQTREAVEADLVGQAVLVLMGRYASKWDSSEWVGTSTELLDELEEVGEAASLFKRQKNGKVDTKGWPGGPQVLSRRLNEISSNLRDIGIELDKRQLKKRTVALRWLWPPTEGGESTVGSVGTDGETAPVEAFPDATDGTDGELGALGNDNDFEEFEIAVGGGA